MKSKNVPSRFGLGLLVLASAFSPIPSARAAAELSAADLALFREAVLALEAHEADRAVNQLETLADRGVVHPDVAYNRGVAYLERADAAVGKPGDRGQAVAAFAEASKLAPDDERAELALEEAELRAARDRARRGGEPTVDTAPLTLRVLGHLDPTWLLSVRILGSVLLTAGLLLGFARSASRRLAGNVVVVVGGLVLAVTTGLDAARSDLLRGAPAVVIAERAPLVDALGRPEKTRRALVEAQIVQVRSLDGRLARVLTNGDDVLVDRSHLRFLRPSMP